MKQNNLFYQEMEVRSLIADLVNAIANFPTIEEKVDALNYARAELHSISPFKNNPVDFVEWVKCENVRANDYNPNSVAPPEMKLLKLSIDEDGYTQPIVSDKVTKDDREVVDGFHRSRVGKEYKDVNKKLHGYLPLVTIKESQKGKQSRIAATIRHNRARGTHAIKGMSAIVLELTNMNWSDDKIAKHLGMDAEEVLKLKQATGLKQAFANHEFSKSWKEFERKTRTNFKEDLKQQ